MDGITWVGSPNHYNGRNGYTVTHITLHIMVGTPAHRRAPTTGSAQTARYTNT